MEQILEKLFESAAKVKLLRLFLRNDDHSFTFPEIVSRTQVRSHQAKTELNKLIKVGLIKAKKAAIREEIIRKRRHSKKPPKVIVKFKKTRVYFLDKDFRFADELKNLVAKASMVSRTKLLRQVKDLGKVKLAVLSGIFVNGNGNSRTDLLVVGDRIKRAKMDALLSRVESEIGRELQYTVMETPEFKYRMDMYDRFLRDILEYPHEKLVNKLNI